MKPTIEITFDEQKSRKVNALIYRDSSGRYYNFYGDTYFYCMIEPFEVMYPVTECKFVVVDKL